MSVEKIDNELIYISGRVIVLRTEINELLKLKSEQESKKTDKMSEINIELVLREIAERMERDMRHVSRLIDAKYHRGNKNV